MEHNIITRAELTLLGNVIIMEMEIKREDVESLELKYGLCPLYFNSETYIVYGNNRSGETKKIGKLIILENDKLKIEEWNVLFSYFSKPQFLKKFVKIKISSLLSFRNEY